MSRYFGFDNLAGRDPLVEPHRCEMFGTPGVTGFCKHAAHGPDLTVEVTAQGGLAMPAQAAGAVLDGVAGDLRHTGGGRAGPR
jgi:hypothetical protein